MAPFWLQKSTKIRKKPLPRGIKKLIDFCIDFPTIFGPFWEPTWSHVGDHFLAKTAQEASKTPQDAQPERDMQPAPCPPEPRGAPELPAPPPDLDFKTILMRFRKIFGSIPASSNLFPKEACLLKFAFQKSQAKIKTFWGPRKRPRPGSRSG